MLHQELGYLGLDHVATDENREPAKGEAVVQPYAPRGCEWNFGQITLQLCVSHRFWLGKRLFDHLAETTSAIGSMVWPAVKMTIRLAQIFECIYVAQKYRGRGVK
jgi:hypothetical protein